MSTAGVSTYQMVEGRVALVRESASMAAASALLPDGAYTTLRTYGGCRLLRLDRHLDRLDETVALQQRSGRVDRDEARALIRHALASGGHRESRLRLTFAPPEFSVSVESFAPLPASAYRDGVACVSLDLQRANPHAKDTRFIAVARSAYRGLPPGVEEGLLVAPDGAVLEGLSSNFFAVKAGRLRTAAERVLHGVTRSLVLEAAAVVMPVDGRAVARAELDAIEEAFVTSVSREVLPVVAIDGRAVGEGRVGPMTRAVMEAFRQMAAREAEPA